MESDDRPLFRSHLRVAILPPEHVLLLSEFRPRKLTGRAFVELARLIDGQRTERELADAVSGRVSPNEAYYALELLRKNGHIVSGNGRVPNSESAYWDALGVDNPLAGGDSHERRRVRIEFVGSDLPSDAMQQALRHVGLEISENQGLTIVVTDDYLRPELALLNRRIMELGDAWLLIKPTGVVPWVGPLFQPNQTACWECLADRIRINRQVDGFLERSGGRGGEQAGLIPMLASTVSLATNLVALEAAKALAGVSSLRNRLVTIDTARLQFQFHALVRQPHCPGCGQPLSPDREPLPLDLQSRRRSRMDDGGYRIQSSAKTLESIESCISPITGVIGEICRIDRGTKDGLHVYFANHAAAPAETLPRLIRALRGNSAGKGTSSEQAKVSACCEALERHCGVFRGTEIRRTASYDDLRDRAIPPNQCMLYSERQFAERERYNAGENRFDHVPEPLDPQSPLSWSPVWSLTRREFRYLPTSFCYYDFPRRRFCLGDSNGNAAGNCREEAVLQGFLELVERDAVAIWWYNRIPRPRVDPEILAEPFLDGMKQAYASLKREFHLLDVTSDLGIPVVAAVSRSVASNTEDVCLGFGAHFDPRIAVRRAITEMSQMLPELRSGIVGGIRKSAPADIMKWWQTATYANQPYLVPAGNSVSDLTPPTHAELGDDLLDAVLRCQSLVEDLGLELLVLDQTRADIPLPVVKVIVPGLRHFWRRLAPGRLYDVPVKLGWLDRRLSEPELNPIPVLI